MESDQDLVHLVHSLPQGDPQRERACTELIARYASIVGACVRRYRGFPEPEDLTQVGYVGLLKAINNFDSEIGESLGAYAQLCVSGEIKRYFRDKRWQIRVPRAAQELRLAIREATGRMSQELARSPTDGELADYLGVAPADIAAARAASEVFQVASLDAPVTSAVDSASLGDMVGAEDPDLQHGIEIDAVWQYCGDLPAREQRLLMMRFYGNMTQAQIGAELGISQMHVSRLLDRSLTYLRQKMTETDPAAEVA
jgi:RNA polymerase sigma-B factor